MAPTVSVLFGCVCPNARERTDTANLPLIVRTRHGFFFFLSFLYFHQSLQCKEPLWWRYTFPLQAPKLTVYLSSLFSLTLFYGGIRLSSFHAHKLRLWAQALFLLYLYVLPRSTVVRTIVSHIDTHHTRIWLENPSSQAWRTWKSWWFMTEEKARQQIFVPEPFVLCYTYIGHGARILAKICSSTGSHLRQREPTGCLSAEQRAQSKVATLQVSYPDENCEFLSIRIFVGKIQAIVEMLLNHTGDPQPFAYCMLTTAVWLRVSRRKTMRRRLRLRWCPWPPGETQGKLGAEKAPSHHMGCLLLSVPLPQEQDPPRALHPRMTRGIRIRVSSGNCYISTPLLRACTASPVFFTSPALQ